MNIHWTTVVRRLATTLLLSALLASANALRAAETNTSTTYTPTPDAIARNEFEIGQALMRENNFAGAVEAFQQATMARTNFAEAHQQWGVALLQLGRLSGTPHLQGQRWQEAAAQFSRASELRPKDTANYLLWSDTLSLIGDLPVEASLRLACYQGAIEKCRKALELEPRNWNAYNKWAGILTAKLPEFAANDEARVELHLTAAGLYSNAVERATFSGDVGSACVNWGAALVRSARATKTNTEKQDRLRQAIEKFERATRTVRNSPMTYTMWGSALVQLGKATGLRDDFRRGVEQFNMSLSLKPDDTAALYALACTHALMRNPIMAVETLKKCFAVDASGAYRKLAMLDPDLAALRGELNFQELFAAPAPRRSYTTDSPPLRDGPR